MANLNKKPDRLGFENRIFENPERPFTELLELLCPPPSNKPKTKKFRYDADTLYASYKHTTNLVATLIWGIESFGYILALAASTDEMRLDYASGAGYFLKCIANLLDATSHFRSELEQELQKFHSKELALKI